MGRQEEELAVSGERREHKSHKSHKSHRRDKRDRYEKSERPERDHRDRDVNKHGGQQEAGEATPEALPNHNDEAHPDAQKPAQVSEAGGEISMSVEETNRVRISLGLKPLSMDNGREAKAKEQAAQRAKQEAEADRMRKAELAERLEKQKERRRHRDLLQSTKALGEEEEGGDDVAGWVERSRLQLEAEKQAALNKTADARRPARRQGSDGDSEDEAMGIEGITGMRIRHKAEDLADGDAVIMTLADRNILDERGELAEDEDILEEGLLAERKKREKARKAATKVGQPLFEEDGKRRSILDKYDEEEEEAGLQIGTGGAVTGDEIARRQAEIRSRLQGSQDASAPGAVPMAGTDFYTAEEMAAMLKPKKKKLKKKLRQRPQAVTAEDIDMLEAEAEAAGPAGDDHGSREDRAARQEQVAKQLAAAEKSRMERYERAVEAGNTATLAKQRAAEAEEAAEPDQEEDDLAESLARARRAAAQRAAANGAATVAEEAAKRREEEEVAQAASLLDNDAMFTEASEFARSIQLGEAGEDGRAGRVKAEAPDMADDQVDPAAAAGQPSTPAEPGVTNWGAWVPADKPAGSEADAAAASGSANGVKTEESGEPAMTRERPINRGLGGALSFLKDRGDLTHKVEWSGRTNDMKGEKLLGLDQVYEGANQDSRVARSVEIALTRRDQLGNILTPKQGFRELCYRFHGKPPSKNKMEKAQKKDAEAIAAKRSATSEQDTASLAQQKQESKRSATPYIVLDGKVKPGQSTDPKSSYATADHQVALTPMLGGGHTPLAGRQKVEVMLGMKRAGGSMNPPPPLRKKHK
ncbi:hypothetical protein WJX84_001233 [Apatococcus fuscideae]|uniref:Uncharacterized protein n=1 Tax=Apatococcus fuscideae TaxID=2026836 RepID=A0AAW1SXE5_9CHLO